MSQKKKDSWVSRSTGKSSTSAKLKKQQTYRKYFTSDNNIPVCSFWKEPSTEVYLRKACAMVVDSDHTSDLLLTSYDIYI